MSSTIPLLTLEEHFAAPDIITIPQMVNGYWTSEMNSGLVSIESRIQSMLDNGVSRQILSHVPFPEPEPLGKCQEINTRLHDIVNEHPDLFSGFACLPMAYPADAAGELRRCVRDFGFVGALVDNHTQGVFYDGDEYNVIFEMAQELDVPIYLHPSFASEQMMNVQYNGNYTHDIALNISEHVYGWHAETALHLMRLYAAGLFDKFKDLKLIMGHMGETVPYMLGRESLVTSFWERERSLMEVWQKNIYVTTSGMFDTAPLQCLLAYTPLEHVMLSVDYPFSSNEEARHFIEKISKAGILSEDELTKFVSGNAKRLLKLQS